MAVFARFTGFSLLFAVAACARVFPGRETDTTKFRDTDAQKSDAGFDAQTSHADARVQSLLDGDADAPVVSPDDAAASAIDSSNYVDAEAATVVPLTTQQSSTLAQDGGTSTGTAVYSVNSSAEANSVADGPVRVLRVCWLDVGFEEEKEWIRAAFESNIEPSVLLEFDYWQLCSTEYESDITIRLTGQANPSIEPDAIDGGVGTSSLFLSLDVATNPTAPADASDTEAEVAGCSPKTASPVGPFSDPIGRMWSSERHYCVAADALSKLARQLLPQQVSFACVDPTDTSAVVLEPDFGYHDATSIFNECPPVGAYLSQLDHTLLGETWGRRRGSSIWFGLGSLGTLMGAASPLLADRLFTEYRPILADATQFPVIGDFNGDGFDDILAYGKEESRDVIVFGASNFAWDPHDTEVSGNYLPIAGDFDGDGFDDIFWYATGEEVEVIWFGDSTASFSRVTQLDVSSGCVPVAGDFNGDARTDIFLHAPGEAEDLFLYATEDMLFERYVPNSPVLRTYVPLTGDFDGNGFDDIVLYGVGTELDFIWWSSGTTFDEETITAKYIYQPITGDFDGNGISDILWARDETFEPLWLFDASGIRIDTRTSCKIRRLTSDEYAVPYAGDFDGNGISDVLWL